MTNDWLVDVLTRPCLTIGKEKEPEQKVELHQHNYYFVQENGTSKLIKQSHSQGLPLQRVYK